MYRKKTLMPETMVERSGTFVGGQNGPGSPNFDLEDEFYRKHSK
jgi:hypothetical protein